MIGSSQAERFLCEPNEESPFPLFRTLITESLHEESRHEEEGGNGRARPIARPPQSVSALFLPIKK